MWEYSVIEPIEQAENWHLGLTIAPTSNGKIRMCVDLTNLHKDLKESFILFPVLLIGGEICLKKLCF